MRFLVSRCGGAGGWRAGAHRHAVAGVDHGVGLGGRPGDQSGQPATGEAGRGQNLRSPAGLKAPARAAFRSRPAPPRSAASTTGRSPTAHPFDGAPVQHHPEPVGYLLGDLRSRSVRLGADEVDDLGSQLDRSTAVAPLVHQPNHPRLVERRRHQVERCPRITVCRSSFRYRKARPDAPAASRTSPATWRISMRCFRRPVQASRRAVRCSGGWRVLRTSPSPEARNALGRPNLGGILTVPLRRYGFAVIRGSHRFLRPRDYARQREPRVASPS